MQGTFEYGILKGRESERIMSGILYDARKIKAYEGLQDLCLFAGLDTQWCNRLWMELLSDSGLLEELLYYLDHHSLLGTYKCEGYSLIDLFIWQMDLYNLIMDSGKNTEGCNKETMVLKAFMSMTEMKKDPAYYIKRLSGGFGMDKS